ncbi:DUF4416 family protein [Nitrospirota bacterium]
MKNHPRAILFSGILYADEAYRKRALDAMISAFGPLRHESRPVPWHSDHYSEELGTPIMRQFLFFRDLISQDALKDTKNRARLIENDLSVDGRRRVNLDPGLIAPARVVLATTKDYAHRIYLGEGVYAEATLTFKSGRFVPSEFAYSDYTEEKALGLFKEMRDELLREAENGT